ASARQVKGADQAIMPAADDERVVRFGHSVFIPTRVMPSPQRKLGSLAGRGFKCKRPQLSLGGRKRR
ncbi:hypothetical protein ACSTHL_23645, partial [Vibrio parahaemolyticus]